MALLDLINRVTQGDCVELMKQIPAESIDMICTDPPYGIDFKSARTSNHDYIENDDFETWNEKLDIWFLEFKRIIKPNGVVCCFSAGGGSRPTTPILTMKAMNYFNLINTLVWVKCIGLGWRYRPSYENILVLSKDKNNYAFYDETHAVSNVISGIGKVVPTAEEHPTQKPVKLIERLISLHTREGELVLDPFFGSGSTGVACRHLKRNFIGMEMVSKYCEMARKNLADESQFDVEI